MSNFKSNLLKVSFRGDENGVHYEILVPPFQDEQIWLSKHGFILDIRKKKDYTPRFVFISFTIPAYRTTQCSEYRYIMGNLEVNLRLRRPVSLWAHGLTKFEVPVKEYDESAKNINRNSEQKQRSEKNIKAPKKATKFTSSRRQPRAVKARKYRAQSRITKVFH